MKPTLVQKLSLFFLLFTAFSYPGQNFFQRLQLNPGRPKVLSQQVTFSSFDFPTNTQKSLPGSYSAQSIVIYDPRSATLLYQKNARFPLHPASTTKIMTALVALDAYSLTDVITVKTADRAIGNTMKLIPGDRLTVKDLLYGLLVASANDAAVALAENFPQGGYSGFVTAMNTKAKELKLQQTHYTNVSGIEGNLHKTTALDLALLTKAAMKNELFAQIVATKNYTVTDESGLHPYYLESTNELLGIVEGLKGVKTGWTENAGECLVTLTERHGHQLIIVVLNSTDRFAESRRLIDWAFASHTWLAYN